MADIVTTNVREDEFNTILGYDMVRLDNLQNNCTIQIKVLRKMCSERLDWIELRILLNEFEMFI